MDMSTTWATIWLTVSILHGLPLSAPSLTQLARKRLTLPKDKKQLERMSRGHLEFCRPALQLFVEPLNKAIHDFIFQCPQATQSFIGRFIEDLGIMRDNQRSSITSVVLPQRVQQRPKKPPLGFCEIHVDAGVLAGRESSAAAICRDEGSNYMGSSALVVEGVFESRVVNHEAHSLVKFSLSRDMGRHISFGVSPQPQMCRTPCGLFFKGNARRRCAGPTLGRSAPSR